MFLGVCWIVFLVLFLLAVLVYCIVEKHRMAARKNGESEKD